MKRLTTLTICLVLVSVAHNRVTGESAENQLSSPDESVEEVKKRPDLGVDYGTVAKFKLASRRTTYRIGEMIGIDLAIMNTLDTPVFFHELSRPSIELVARDEKGAEVSINSYTTALEATAPRSYLQIEPGHLLVASFRVLAGCTSDLSVFTDQRDKVIREEFGRGEAAYFKRVFQDLLFVDWGQACLSVKAPGRYTLTAEQMNDTVLVSSKRPKVRTAVGTIRSTSLTVTITQ